MKDTELGQGSITGTSDEFSAMVEDFTNEVRFGEPKWVALCDTINSREALRYLEERRSEAKTSPTDVNNSWLRVAETDLSFAKNEVSRNRRDVREYDQAALQVFNFLSVCAKNFQNSYPDESPENVWAGGLRTLVQVRNAVNSRNETYQAK